MKRVEEDIAYTLISQQEIYDKVHEIGRKIADDFDGKEPVFVGVLKGCFMFMADLIRCVNISSEIEFMAVSSYSGTNSTGAVRINKDLKGDINGRHIILVEDILDSGVTLNYLKNYLKVREPASISIATLLDKPARRKAPIYAVISALMFRMNSSSDMGWITMKNTATCLISAFLNRRSIPDLKRFPFPSHYFCLNQRM